MDSLTTGPRLSSASANIAYRRIDAMLRAYGVQHAAVRGVHAHSILRKALAVSDADGMPLEETAARLVLEQIRTSIEKLAPHVVDAETPADLKRLLLAIKQWGIPQKRPEVLLEEPDLDAEAMADLRRFYRIQPTPEIRRLSMGAPAIRFESIDEVADSTTAAFGKLPAVRYVLATFAALLFLSIVYLFAK